MPELPEVEALTRFLDERLAGKVVERCELAAIAALKTFDPPLSALVGRQFVSCTRRGKYLCLDMSTDAGGTWLVMHLARGGWVKWYDALPAGHARPGRGPLALRVGVQGGAGFDVTEMGTEKRLALWVVHDPADVEGVATLGPDPLDPAFDRATLATLLSGAPGTLKTALSSQSLIAGIGNAYSDEIIHAARLSPFKPARNIDADEAARLYDAVVQVLGDALGRAVGSAASELKGDKKRALRVHGRTGEPCPVCGDRIREVWSATRSLQYCPTCQTGGKPLADHRLSKLIR
ncbi:MAG TPA: DNA-formamidopyrimidine glycosylase family protein [Acidimicrobiales bacterium]|nr:DNA-formamidopyrimidine glycosylase family protein [Acidimicrobiales bacterium]